MQAPLTFPEPISGADLMSDLTVKFQSIASSRMGETAPEDVQDGEIWVKITPDTGEKTIMLRSSGADIAVINNATVQNATQWNSKSQWVGAESSLPTTRDANTIYFVYEG